MRRLLLGPLAVCVLAACLSVAPDARAADVPYAGTWRVHTLLFGTNEAPLWLIKIDKDAKKSEVVTGLKFAAQGINIDVRKTVLKDAKGDDKTFRCQLFLPNTQTFGLAAYPGKNKDVMVGSLRSNLASFIPVRLERTEDTEIDAAKPLRQLPGSADFQAAVQNKDQEDRIKALQDILKDHDGKLITYLSSQLLLGELVGKKAAAAEFKEPAAAYVKQGAAHGHEMEIGANLVVGQMLTGYDKTQEMALPYLKKAADLLSDEDPKGLAMSVYLAQVLALDKNKKADEIKPVVEKIARVSEATVKMAKNDDEKFGYTQLVAGLSLGSPNAAAQDVGLRYAEDLVKLVKATDPASRKLAAYNLLAEGLKRRGKADEAKPWLAKMEAMEEDLDKDFEKQNISFELAKFGGRKGKSERVALVELFTGAQCPPCIAADKAFDAGIKTYKPADVVFLQYHLHVPGPDALTTADGEARERFYGDEVSGTPTMFIDGKLTPTMGGFQQHAAERYESLRELLAKALEDEADCRIKLQVNRNGDKIDVNANVSGLKKPGEKLRLRFVLVEEVARYVGSNQQRLHHHVVRALPGGAAGFGLAKEAEHKASVDLAEWRAAQTKYLDAASKRLSQPNRPAFTARPMELKKLKVVAFVQDDESKKVYQAAQADVPGAPGKKE